MGDTQTRWADWIDLLTPYVVTGAAAGALRGGGASRGNWTLFWFATVLYTQGQGIHLAANSINNAVAGRRANRRTSGTSTSGTTSGTSASTWWWSRSRWRWPTGGRAVGSAAHVLALLVGFTDFTNSVEGQTPWLGIGVAVVFAVLGAADPRRHGPAAAHGLRLLAAAVRRLRHLAGRLPRVLRARLDLSTPSRQSTTCSK